MTELFPVLVPLLIVDAINPVLFALMLVALSSARPIANSLSLLAGHTLAYFAAGIVFALGLQQISSRLLNPQPLDYVISLGVGLLCLWAALKSGGGAASEDKTPEKPLTPLFCFGFGALVNFVGVPFAVPYLAALDQMMKADMSVHLSLLTLAAYNIAYALPFALVPLLRVVFGDRCMPFLQWLNSLLVRAADTLMPLALLLIGLGLVADSVLYFWSGEGLV